MLKLFESSDAKSIYKICHFLDGIITEFPHEIHDYSWILLILLELNIFQKLSSN